MRKETAEYELQIGIALMASGFGERFGANKLLEKAGDRTVIERTLSLLSDCGDLFLKENIVVVTRYTEIAVLAQQQGYVALLHSMPWKSDTVRLGTRFLRDRQGILFLQADQFLLEEESLRRMVRAFRKDPSHPVRLAFQGQMGSPVLFPPEYYERLTGLQGDCGGAGLLKTEQLKVVEAQEEWELWDADTKEELRRMVEVLEKKAFMQMKEKRRNAVEKSIIKKEG